MPLKLERYERGGTKYGPIIKPGPVKPGKPIRGRDVAAKFIYEQLLGAGEAKG
jgi:hypothetical protein